MNRVVLCVLCLSFVYTKGESQIIDDYHDVNKDSPIYNKLMNFIRLHETPGDHSDRVRYLNLVDSNNDNYGIFMFDLAQIPSGKYLFYKNKGSAEIKIVGNYRLEKLQKFLLKFFKKNGIDKTDQVKYLYSFARFYDDYVYIHSSKLLY